MSTISLLHRLIKQALPELHRTRLKALMATVEAGLKGTSVTLTALGRALSGRAYLKHKIKRIDRLLGNSNLKSERQKFYGVMTQWLLQSLALPLVIVDWSPLTADQSQQLLRAALPTGGRTITLCEEIHPRKKLGNPRVQQQFLSRLQAFLPPGVTPIIVADSGFRTPFFRAVEAFNWHWLGRIRGRDFIAWADESKQWLPAKSLYARATRKAKCLGKALWVRSNPLPGTLVAFYRAPKHRKDLTVQHRPAQSRSSRKQAAREKEPWLLVVSPSLKDYTSVDVVNYYRSRMQIEEGFRDTKSTHYGADLTQDSRISA
ncbi:IS4 family transposase [Methylotuvimicrobium sp. KM1]|uniref:IS4 family transposase n=1 Tax=Methylotuvimicrobium sp. KM1 TaxID=3377707 RepID=UPI003850963F